MTALDYFIAKKAVRAARWSECLKSRRGVVLFDGEGRYRHLWWSGFNHPPGKIECSDACMEDGRCGKHAIHAEIAALNEFHNHGQITLSLKEVEGLHIKVDDDGVPVTSFGPSCVQCSKHYLEVGIRAFWLFHDEGFWAGGSRDREEVRLEPFDGVFVRYEIQEFHELSLKANGLPVL